HRIAFEPLQPGSLFQPVIAPPPAVYGLVVLEDTDDGKVYRRAAVPLFATAPLPQIIEYADPDLLIDDLARGLVRRRAVFQWNYGFEGVRPRKPEQQQFGPRASLVKIDRTGGGQVPDREDDFWLMGQ